MMLEGKYGKAFVTIEDPEQECISQIYSFLNHPVFTNYIAIMPDTHAGNGAVIGFTMPMTDKVISNVIGVDIGCGILSLKISGHVINWEKIDKIIRRSVPLGFNTHLTPIATIEKDFPWNTANQHIQAFLKEYKKLFNRHFEFEGFTYAWYLESCKQKNINPAQVDSSIGTLGGGNHFIEIGIDNNSDHWLTIHSGSRNFGLKIAQYWQKFAQGLPENKQNNKDLAYLSYPFNLGYLTDMIFVQHFAQLNRRRIAEWLNADLDLHYTDSIESIHNYIDFSDMIIRKGAIRSYAGERLIIPFNMRDGILICEGKSNKEWNYSAPHGSGRTMSRTQAKKCLDIEQFKNQMTGIYSTCIGKETLDEAPDSYKPSEMIEQAIAPTAKIINRIKPLYNLKG